MAKNKEKSSGGCLSGVFVIILLIIIIGGCARCGNNDDSSDSKPKTHKVAKKNKPTKAQSKRKKQQERDIKDSQKSMSDDLHNDPILSKYAYKVIYKGESTAEIKVTDNFASLSVAKKNALAKKFNNLVTSNTEDDTEASEDPYSLLTFVTHTEKLVGHSKQFDHNAYKWSK